MLSSLQSWWGSLPERDAEAGQGLVEYVLIVALIAMGSLVAITLLGGGISGVMTRLAGRLAGVG